MLNGEVGKDFRARSRRDDRERSRLEGARILIIDPVIGSRILLADEVVKAGFIAVTVSNMADARITLEREEIALIVADENVSGPALGLPLLVELRNLYPEIPRALLVQEENWASVGKAVAQAEISFLLRKPLDAHTLREALRNVFLGGREFGGWDHVSPQKNGTVVRRIQSHVHTVRSSVHPAKDARHEMILRGLLAGLNSIEFEDQLFPFIDRELAEAFQIQRWLFQAKHEGAVTRVRDNISPNENAASGQPDAEEQMLLHEARGCKSARRLLSGDWRNAPERSRLVCLGFVLEETGETALTCLVWCDEACSEPLLEMLRDLRHGLNLTLRRVRDTERRAQAARELAHRVSLELKNPVGALTHAVDRMRGEAVRAGMPTDSLDRVLTESKRVFQAVDHLEDEIGSDRPIAPIASS